MLEFIKNFFTTKKEKLDYTELMGRGAVIIDVRTPQEFAEGTAENFINIPLSEITSHIEKIKGAGKPIITCCHSGGRSGKARTILTNAGIEAYNGGSWNQVQANLTV